MVTQIIANCTRVVAKAVAVISDDSTARIQDLSVTWINMLYEPHTVGRSQYDEILLSLW